MRTRAADRLARLPGRAWLSTHDPGYGALRRAGRAAIVMPALFALSDKVIANPTMSYFVAFGSFAMLLLVDFSGSMRDRLSAQAALGLACAVLICLGTLASESTPVAAVAMVVVAFVILFSGVVSSVLAGATTSLLLAFILPVSLPGPASQIPDRVAGWGLAAAVSLLAISLLWPSPAGNPVRTAALSAARALAARLRAEVAFVMSAGDEAAQAAHRAAVARADDAVQHLHSLFFATPYRPTGLATDARALVRLVDELRWANAVVLRAAPRSHPRQPNRPVCRVKTAAAEVLERAADLLEAPRGTSQALDAALAKLREALGALERATTSELPTDSAPSAGERARRVVSALDPSFRALELSFVVEQIAANASFAAAAQRRSWLDRILGRQPAGFAGALASFRERAGSHARWSSSWLQNSLRGAVALGLAVLVADVSGVQHGFWVVFGTLAVLRSNALSTGQNIVRAMLGTTTGFVIGGVLVYLIGTNTAVLWVLLPLVILVAGLAPATISFAAGQAAFTVTLLILFNILVPAGWKIGLLRIEDVAIGSAVSLGVGLLFWPRGAAAALGRSLSEAYAVSARYLADAVAYGVSRCDAAGPGSPPPAETSVQAAAASRRLDDTFRSYLGERGAKPIPLAEVTSLVTGVAGVRLAADAVLDLWDGGAARGGDRAAARRELLEAADHLTGWYDHFADSLTGAEQVPDPLAPDQDADGRLVDAVASDLHDSDGNATATGVRVIWTGDHLDAVRRLQEVLVDPARAAVAEHALSAGSAMSMRG
ncbi:MAG TPA: FUSC family protein [Solirubrobacteraceae bacterium]|nr:FUSC family protein [Solirubrobacteraceae bacterium]